MGADDRLPVEESLTGGRMQDAVFRMQDPGCRYNVYLAGLE